jgi:hypothetical protein
VQDQPVVRVAPERLRHDLVELRFDLVRRLAGREPGAVADAEDVRVDSKGFLTESCIEDNIRRLAADARQRLQLFTSRRDLSAVLVDQCLA